MRHIVSLGILFGLMFVATTAHSVELAGSDAEFSFGVAWGAGAGGCQWTLDESSGPEFETTGLDSEDCDYDWSLGATGDRLYATVTGSEWSQLIGYYIFRHYSSRLSTSVTYVDSMRIAVVLEAQCESGTLLLALDVTSPGGEVQSFVSEEFGRQEANLVVGPGTYAFAMHVQVEHAPLYSVELGSYFPHFDSLIEVSWSAIGGVPVSATSWGQLKAMYK